MAGAADLNPYIAAGEIGLGAIEAGIGIAQGIKAKKEAKKLLSQRKAYQTPDEIAQILQATQANAQQGYDATTLNYLTNQTDQAFSSGLDSAVKLGADPNDLSSLFGQKINAIMKIGVDNHQLNMQNFSQYLGALNTVAANKAAEQKSQQDILKDKIAATGVQMNAATGNISEGINTALSGAAALGMNNLYNPDGTLKVNATTAQRTDAANPALVTSNNLRSQVGTVQDLSLQAFQIPQLNLNRPI